MVAQFSTGILAHFSISIYSLHTDTLRHIPEISCYNHNYYIGLKRGNSTIHDLLFAVSNDDNLTEWYIVLGNCIKYIGYEYSDKGVINLSEEQS